jgi:hypothetical protein
VLTTLWISNAGATLATLTYITANRHDGTFTRSLLVPLVLFTLGLTVPGMSSLVEFECERRAMLRSRASRIMPDGGTDVERGAEELEFTLKWRLPQRWHLVPALLPDLCTGLRCSPKTSCCRSAVTSGFDRADIIGKISLRCTGAPSSSNDVLDFAPRLSAVHATTRVHHPSWRRGGMAARGLIGTVSPAPHRSRARNFSTRRAERSHRWPIVD